ncbi:MAG: lysozyme inhibitor LprI family protein [Neorhizobium sp.]|jgi:uncharacterized protein YecT (DUF1311 family)|nr:lysozyme inhibitor LprI family protein [Neorhizobium sp.]
MKIYILGLSLSLFAGSALADDLYDSCMSAADGTNPAYAKCGGDWIARADADLNTAWKSLYGDAEGQTKVDLLAEQRAWNAYKEQSCTFLSNGDAGREGQVIAFPACRAKVIEARTQELEDYASPQE